MADLEKMLLEVAGRSSSNRNRRQSPPTSKKRRKDSYSDDGSDSRDDDSDDSRRNRKQPSGNKFPLKKRVDTSERDDSPEEGENDSNQDRDSDDESIGSDLYKNEEDRQELAQMTELDREMILATRSSKRSDKRIIDKGAKDNKNNSNSNKGKQMGKESPPPTISRGMRSSTRSADRVAAKDDALNELRAKRRRQLDTKSRDSGREGSRSRGFSPSKRRPFSTASAAARASSSSESESDSDSDSDEESTGDGGLADSDEEKASRESLIPNFEDIKEITIRRSKLSKWFMEPFFDELIVGCFVRVGIGKSRSGPIYRLCTVRNVDCSDPDRQYKLDNKTTCKYLNVVWGNESTAARWQMTMISDSPPVKAEFDQWVREVERNGGRMPSKHDVAEKAEAIRKTNTFVYSAATVKQMLQEKKSATWRPLNIAAEKDRLRREMEVAQMKHDETEVERIKARLLELEAAREAQRKDLKAIRLAEMNKRNRAENFKNASEVKRVNTSLKAGEDGYDPFSRRWTRSRNYYVPKPAEVKDEAAAATAMPEIPNGNGVVGGAEATAAALEAAADAGKLVDTSAPVDQGTESNVLHNFELPISLAVLQKFGGPHGPQAGFMARKQRIEATIGCRVPENDGRRHALTLTVSDYKRRRGLL